MGATGDYPRAPREKNQANAALEVPTFPPERIVCLTEETVETLYLLGEQDRIVGISGYCVRPPEARREKPRVSVFTSADIQKILDIKPDLVLHDLQADIVAALMRHGVTVHASNQRSLAEIFGMIRMLGAMVGASEMAEELANFNWALWPRAREPLNCLVSYLFILRNGTSQ